MLGGGEVGEAERGMLEYYCKRGNYSIIASQGEGVFRWALRRRLRAPAPLVLVRLNLKGMKKRARGVC